ncbi:hypothetical protein [Roseovarius indicus]|uniref:Uncharacterized protein n=1 Tax=Roseovarius indicus TaxID=540747 RepID=A0A0T5P385_9RHOB|nr:hypothetical protein [Roseovarius indicus]KRS15650.1 hypothetical protein XM52_22690 [Roseovarius indicus]QEW27840.1 hypothetical protein RIdsm_03661 [Roseovarius indicus]SFE79449.1 hypothetical protein SAMN04488031_12226 [Roseovarius indicus]
MTKTKAKPAGKKTFSGPQLKRFASIAAQIAEFNHEIPQWFIQQLKDDHGMTLNESPKGSGRWVATIGGLKTRPQSTRQMALKIWANKARRAVAAAEG